MLYKRFIETPARWSHLIAALIILPIMVLVVAADVLARYFLHAPIFWAQDVSTLALLIFFIVAMPIATEKNTHIRVETLYEHFSPPIRSCIDVLSCLAGTAFTGLLAYWELREIPGMYRRGDGAHITGIPHWPVSLVLGMSAAFVTLILLAQALQALGRLTGDGDKK